MNEDKQAVSQAEAFCRLHKIQPGFQFDDHGTLSQFSRIGGTGMLICHPVGEPDTQSSWAMSADNFYKSYLLPKKGLV
jgi:hypothetical protein